MRRHCAGWTFLRKALTDRLSLLAQTNRTPGKTSAMASTPATDGVGVGSRIRVGVGVSVGSRIRVGVGVGVGSRIRVGHPASVARTPYERRIPSSKLQRPQGVCFTLTGRPSARGIRPLPYNTKLPATTDEVITRSLYAEPRRLRQRSLRRRGSLQQSGAAACSSRSHYR